jgi:hypothetical protein
MIADFHHPMTNLLAQAINCNDGDRAAKIIQNALGIENDDVANYCFRQLNGRTPLPAILVRFFHCSIRNSAF